MSESDLKDKITEMDKNLALLQVENHHALKELSGALQEHSRRMDRLDAAYRDSIKEIGLLKSFQARILGASVALSLVWSFVADKIKF